MNNEALEDRVNALGADVAGLKRDVAHHGHQLSEIGSGVRQLLDREARRPEPMGLKTVVGTVGSVVSIVGAMAFFTWWFISTSPVVTDLDRRLTKLDDKEIGRVPRLERDAAWSPRVTSAK